MNTRLSYNYKGRIIDARAYPLRDGGWTAHFSIEDHRGLDILDTSFETGHRFPTRETAQKAAIRLGMHKIETGFDIALVSQ